MWNEVCLCIWHNRRAIRVCYQTFVIITTNWDVHFEHCAISMLNNLVKSAVRIINIQTDKKCHYCSQCEQGKVRTRYWPWSYVDVIAVVTLKIRDVTPYSLVDAEIGGSRFLWNVGNIYQTTRHLIRKVLYGCSWMWRPLSGGYEAYCRLASDAMLSDRMCFFYIQGWGVSHAVRFVAGFMLAILFELVFNPEDGGNTFLRNIG
jgi:hypothetical protein